MKPEKNKNKTIVTAITELMLFLFHVKNTLLNIEYLRAVYRALRGCRCIRIGQNAVMTL